MAQVTEDSQQVLTRAVALLENGDARAALAELDSIPEAGRWMNSRYWELMARARLTLGHNLEAIAAANWALSIEPHDARLYAVRFEAEREQGLIAEAERSILSAIRLQPVEVSYQVAYAWLLAAAGDLAKAGRVNAAARRNGPDHVEALWQAAELARLQGKDTEAVATGYKLLESSAPEPFKRALLGRLLIGLERESEAAAQLNKSGDSAAMLGLDPRDVVLANHWVMRPYALIERLGPVATPALLIALAILLLALNLVNAALAVAGVIWIVFLFSFVTAPVARFLRRALRR